MIEHETIYLEPMCDDPKCCLRGRVWSETPHEVCQTCNRDWVEFKLASTTGVRTDHLRALDAMRTEQDAAQEKAARLEAETRTLVEVLSNLEIRRLVAGWNGENRPGGPFTERHPRSLLVRLPTNSGVVYDLDKAIIRTCSALEAP